MWLWEWPSPKSEGQAGNLKTQAGFPYYSSEAE